MFTLHQPCPFQGYVYKREKDGDHFRWEIVSLRELEREHARQGLRMPPILLL